MALDPQRLKRFLNREATARLTQLGYSGAMASDAKREGWWWIVARSDALKRWKGLLGGHAVVWTAAGRAELVSVEVPRPGFGEVAIDVLSSVVSPGTERAQYLRLPNTSVSFPHRPGYSVAGRVVAVGAGVPDRREGDLVAAVGVPHASVWTTSAEHVYAVPRGVPPEEAALVMLGVISAQGVRLARLAPGEPVCVLGAGLVGVLAQRIATATGAGPVTVVATSNSKEAVARAGGAAQFLVADDEDEIAALAAPVVIEATGDPAAISLAAQAVAPNGRIVLLGTPRGMTPDLPLGVIKAKGLRVLGAHVETLTYESALTGKDAFGAEAKRFLALLGSGQLVVSDLVATAVDPREADAFYRELAADRGLVSARFDWTCLAREDRVRVSRWWRLPDLSGRGLDLHKKPMSSPSASPWLGDPYAGASGALRIGLLGAGDIAVANAAAIVAAPNTALSGCFDPATPLAEDVVRSFGGRVFGSSDALLEDPQVEAVFICVPHHLHAPLAIQALDAGKHVIVEKPMANNLSAALEMATAAERAGRLLTVCFPHRYEARVELAREFISRDGLGEFRGAFVSLLADKPASYWYGGFSSRSTSDWRTSREKAGGGVLIMNLSHYVDLLGYLSGLEPDLVTAFTGEGDSFADVEDAVSVTARYANGALATIIGHTALRGHESGRSELSAWGAKGFVALEPELRAYTLRSMPNVRTGRWHAFGSLPARDIRAVFVSRFATAVHRGEAPDVDLAAGLAAQAFIEAAYRSSELEVAVRPAELVERVVG